jgi:hypothetical protein
MGTCAFSNETTRGTDWKPSRTIECSGYNWGHHVGYTRGYMEINGHTTWGGDIDWLSVPSGTGTTLVEKEEGVVTPPSLPEDSLHGVTAPGDPCTE